MVLGVSRLKSLLCRVISRLTTFQYGTVFIFRHQQLRKLTCPAEIHKVTWGNVDDARDMDSPEMISQYRSFLESGDSGYYAYSKGTVRHRSWVKSGPGTAGCGLCVKFKLKDEDVYVHYCKTEPSARGKGIYSAVLSRITYDMHAMNKTVYIATIESNPASIKGIEKAGFEPVRRVRSLVCFGVPVFQKECSIIDNVLSYS